MNPTALLLLLLSGLVLYLGLSGRLDAVWTAATQGGTGTGGTSSKGKTK